MVGKQFIICMALALIFSTESNESAISSSIPQDANKTHVRFNNLPTADGFTKTITYSRPLCLTTVELNSFSEWRKAGRGLCYQINLFIS